jgi:hypothetical protein
MILPLAASDRARPEAACTKPLMHIVSGVLIADEDAGP